MPIRKDRRHLYPPNWPDIRARILQRATGPDGVPRCEQCGKPDRETVRVVWDNTGRWAPLEATTHPADPDWRDRHGEPAAPPNGQETWCRATFVILTTAHLNHDPTDNSDGNLRSLCQGCHLLWDLKLHQFNRGQTLRYPPHQTRLEIEVPQISPYPPESSR